MIGTNAMIIPRVVRNDLTALLFIPDYFRIQASSICVDISEEATPL